MPFPSQPPGGGRDPGWDTWTLFTPWGFGQPRPVFLSIARLGPSSLDPFLLPEAGDLWGLWEPLVFTHRSEGSPQAGFAKGKR